MNKKLAIMALILSGIAIGNVSMACGLSKDMSDADSSVPETADMAQKAQVVEE